MASELYKTVSALSAVNLLAFGEVNRSNAESLYFFKGPNKSSFSYNEVCLCCCCRLVLTLSICLSE